ncbi:MAG: hypothetical protein KIT31_26250 [Deltaproteobacteria bacterium]|nr:hypothetical protein [Deltaproteobacteria bacterium]
MMKHGGWRERPPATGRRARLVRDASGKQRVIAAERRGRRGAVFLGRYHVVAITSPWQARNVLRYVLNNYRHHDEVESIPGHGPWLLAEGWRRGGPISLHDVPCHPRG